jgi:hypothetical protein
MALAECCFFLLFDLCLHACNSVIDRNIQNARANPKNKEVERERAKTNKSLYYNKQVI